MTPATIADQVAEMRANPARPIPVDIAAAFATWVAHLTAEGVPPGAAKPDHALPDTPMLDVHGAATSLYAVTAGRPAVIVFYRGGWCPYCNIALRTYQAELVPALATRGISLIAISPQTADGSLSSQETKELTFTVLSDPGNQLARQLGILTAPSEGARQAQLQIGLDLTHVNADGTTGLPMPTVIIADAAGTIRWIDVHRDYTTRTEPEQVLQAITQTIS